MEKIRAIVKRPDEAIGHMTNVSNSLSNLQRLVGGHIEAVHIGNVVVLCNEEGRLKNLPYNCWVGGEVTGTAFVGDIVVVAEKDGDFIGLPEDFTMTVWKQVYLRG